MKKAFPTSASSEGLPVCSTQPVEPLVDYRRAAEILGISTRKLWSLVAEGAIPAVRIGRAVRFDPADLRKFIAANKPEGER